MLPSKKFPEGVIRFAVLFSKNGKMYVIEGRIFDQKLRKIFVSLFHGLQSTEHLLDAGLITEYLRYLARTTCCLLLAVSRQHNNR